MSRFEYMKKGGFWCYILLYTFTGGAQAFGVILHVPFT